MLDLEFPIGGHYDLHPGDVILLTTDGLEEAMNVRDEEFGRDRLRAALARLAGEPAETISQGLKAAVLEFVGDAPRRDDLTLIVAKARE
jgi:sigma-B regulation protein RsbU (phosphoserine phosphatase)